MVDALQIEMPLVVAVCAWCRPVVPGAALGTLSHGICPRHFRKLQHELQGITSKRPRSRRTSSLPSEPSLPL